MVLAVAICTDENFKVESAYLVSFFNGRKALFLQCLPQLQPYHELAVSLQPSDHKLLVFRLGKKKPFCNNDRAKHLPAGNPLDGSFALEDGKKHHKRESCIMKQSQARGTDVTLGVLVVQTSEEFASVDGINAFSRSWLYTVYIQSRLALRIGHKS